LEVSGKLHAPVALLLEQAHPLSIGEKARCAPIPVQTMWGGEKLQPLGWQIINNKISKDKD
jgi:hypothetical protein